jgi:hypothetical protein
MKERCADVSDPRTIDNVGSDLDRGHMGVICRTAELGHRKAQVNRVGTLFHWVTENPFTAVSALFGASLLGALLYTYVADYRMLACRK